MEPNAPILAYRIVDQNNGNEIIHSLPHLHQSSWTVNALAKGMPGSAGIGSFSIPCAPIRSDAYMANKVIYDQLVVGQKVEGYLGDVVAGTPRVSGYITSLDRTLDGNLVITGSDTLGWLQKTQVIPGEFIPFVGPTGNDVVALYKDPVRMGFDDSCTSLGSYTQTPASRWTQTTDPETGVSAFNCSTTGSESYVINSTSIPAIQYQGPSYAIGNFLFQAGTDTTTGGEASLVIGSDATAANCVFARVNGYEVGGSSWSFDAEIWTRTASVNTRQLQKVGIMTGLSNQIRVQIILSCYYVGGTIYLHMFVNGQDCGNYVYSNVGTAPSGRIGFRFNANAGGSPNVWAERASFRYRDSSVPLFATGTINSSSVVFANQQHLNGQTNLDMLSMAMVSDGWQVRKNPGAGYRADSIDYAVSPGSDLSSSIVFEDGINLVNLQTTSNADVYSIDTRIAATPGMDSGGGVVYPSSSGNTGDLVLTDTVLNAGTVTFAPLIQFGNTVGALKSTPGQAKTAVVVRDAFTADKWRELDYVTLHAPLMGLNHQKVLVLGYTLTEGDATQTVMFDQYAFDPAYQARRNLDSARIITAAYKTR
jgi:hypothetical protein